MYPVLPDRFDFRGTLGERVAVLEREVADVKDDIKTLRRAFYTLAVSIAGSAVVFGFSVMLLIKK